MATPLGSLVIGDDVAVGVDLPDGSGAEGEEAEAQHHHDGQPEAPHPVAPSGGGSAGSGGGRHRLESLPPGYPDRRRRATLEEMAVSR